MAGGPGRCARINQKPQTNPDPVAVKQRFVSSVELADFRILKELVGKLLAIVAGTVMERRQFVERNVDLPPDGRDLALSTRIGDAQLKLIRFRLGPVESNFDLRVFGAHRSPAQSGGRCDACDVTSKDTASLLVTT
jgi:hypothetical protein